MLPAIILFAVTYVLMISFGKYRPYIALASGALFIITGMLPMNQIIGSLDFNVLLMIGGTMGLVQLFIDSHMPERLADLIMDRVPNIQWAAVALSLFAGIISGAYQIVASNFLFPEKFEESLNATIELLQQSGVYNNEMMDQMSKLMRSYIFSPIPALISNIFGNMLTFGFYGLFISIGTKCEPNIFDSNYEEEDE